MADERPVLVTIPISHYCERARWALDRAGVAYVERRHLQGFHVVAARRAGGGRTVPVLVDGDRVLADSDAIVAFAAQRTELYPDDPGLAAETRALERGFTEQLGPDGRLWMYQRMHGRRDLALGFGTSGVPGWQRRAFALGFPAFTWLIDRVLDVTPAAADAAEAEVRGVFDAVDERLSDGRRFLMGDAFTAADLTFAAMAAPVTVPPGYAVALPQPERLPAAMAAMVREMRARPAGAHALAMFARERR